jgi:uncharacterized protein (TIGR03083 family)
MSERLEALRSSIEHLRSLAALLDPADYARPAYPREWTIADTFSHIGSGAVIAERTVDDTVAGNDRDPAFNQSVWDEWNAKAPDAQVADALVADAALLERLDSTTESQRAEFRFSLGPFDLDFEGFLGLRLSEHVLHTWDVEVVLDPTATLASDAANLIIDGLHRVVRFAGKATGEQRTLTVRTLDPVRDLALIFEPESITLVDAAHEGAVDLEVPAETFARLIYGRLDAEHTPSAVDDEELDELRRAFPGF